MSSFETEVQRPDLDAGDHDRFAHYCKKADIVRSMVTGVAIEALCGKKWVPSANPDRFPICPTCAEIYAKRLLA